jgi:hypothetical protein
MGVPVIRTFILENMGHPHILCLLWVDISTGIELGQQMIRETSLFAAFNIFLSQYNTPKGTCSFTKDYFCICYKS